MLLTQAAQIPSPLADDWPRPLARPRLDQRVLLDKPIGHDQPTLSVAHLAQDDLPVLRSVAVLRSLPTYSFALINHPFSPQSAEEPLIM
jgi:hypothetical protein